MNFVSIFIASPIVRLFLLYLTIISLEMLKCTPLGYKILHPSKNLADVLWGKGSSGAMCGDAVGHRPQQSSKATRKRPARSRGFQEYCKIGTYVWAGG